MATNPTTEMESLIAAGGAMVGRKYRSAIVVVHPDGTALTGGPRIIDWQGPVVFTPAIFNALVLLVDGEPVAAGFDPPLHDPRPTPR